MSKARRNYAIYDEYRQTDALGNTSYQTRPTFEEEINVLTHSYVYHPNLLDMDLGGGLLFVQQDFSTNQGSNNSNESLYNLNARLSFLKRKPYPFSLFYNRSNPSVSTSLSGRFLVENIRYGFQASLLESISPVLLYLGTLHYENRGQGIDTSINDITDQLTLRAFKSYNGNDHIQVSYLDIEVDSKSGSLGLPIQKNNTRSRTIDISARNAFGENDKINVTQLLTLSQQTSRLQNDPATDIDDLRYNFDMRWQHSREVGSFYQYRLTNNQRSDIDTRNQFLVAGVNYMSVDGLRGNLDIHGEKEQQDTTGFNRTLRGSRGNIGYDLRLGRADLRLGASILYDRSGQRSKTSQIQVFDEPLTLSGTAPVALQHEFVEENTIIVRNQAKTQTFIKDLDYRIRTVGSRTEIERLIGGNIIDGETVLVDYDYQTGGSFNLNTLAQNYSVQLRISRFYEFYVRYRDLNQNLSAGVSSIPVNSTRSMLVGARVEYPFQGGWLAGANAEFEDHQEDISPYTRNSLIGYVELSLPLVTRLRITARRETIDVSNTEEDTDLTQLMLRLTSRPWFRTLLTADADFQKDTGGSLIRKRRGAYLGLSWHFRRLAFQLRAESILSQQGAVEQKQAKIMAYLRRNF
ncbi:hypothetical protein QVG61_05895 [Thiohalobacter sp. IOR34]|uniref:hypothetical protein n=1 Tax=Thiohalobacter sp. IOR34 TaxID=3057176 RepID=UPI0025B00CE1|nr:hypothetical protein [Thiohalobacter sp. IOR34]WJW76621.1 hypothetical protein QVG61_05895 [Thiohalobacter sp. IOR34]